MTRRQFSNETRFQATLHFIKRILAAGIFTEDEYQRCFTMMINRYNCSQFLCLSGVMRNKERHCIRHGVLKTTGMIA